MVSLTRSMTIVCADQYYHAHILTNEAVVEASGGVFQIRPRKDFVTAKGRDRILALNLLSDLPSEEHEPQSDIDTVLEPKNAYEFMRRRRDETGDPTTKRWNAAIRLSNFASAESSPLCVCDLTSWLPLSRSDFFRSLLSGRCLTSWCGNVPLAISTMKVSVVWRFVALRRSHCSTFYSFFSIFFADGFLKSEHHMLVNADALL
jgi:hypothetical protein